MNKLNKNLSWDDEYPYIYKEKEYKIVVTKNKIPTAVLLKNKETGSAYVDIDEGYEVIIEHLKNTGRKFVLYNGVDGFNITETRSGLSVIYPYSQRKNLNRKTVEFIVDELISFMYDYENEFSSENFDKCVENALMKYNITIQY